MKLDRYPLDNKGDPLDLLTGVVTDTTGNNGTKTPLNYGPDGVPIDAVGLILTDKDGNPVAFGGIESFINRAALAGAPAAANKVVWLAEAGREGLFQFSTGDKSALVTADPRQGVYIAPSTSPTGTAGAWVRKIQHPGFNVRWFGCAADDATDDSAAFTAAIALLKVLAVNDDGTYKGSDRLRVPAGSYYMGTTTLDITHMLIIEGEGAGLDGGKSSKLRWGLATTGIRVQVHNTSGAGVVDGPHYSGMGCVIRGLYLQGAFNTGVTAEAEAHGIHLKGRALIEDCRINIFQGDGIYIRATAGGGAPSEGNANSFIINRVITWQCRNGIYIDGADVNAGETRMVDTRFNRQWGIWDSSFLGNSHYNPHSDGNGASTGADTATMGASVVSYSGNRYGVKVGQAVGAQTNAPSGTTADNTWWYYMFAGGPVAPSIPTWFNGIVIREGGSYYTDNANASNIFVNPYSENGQNFAQASTSTTILGGNTTWKGGAWARGALGAMVLDKMLVNSDFNLAGPQGYFGDATYSHDLLYQWYFQNGYESRYTKTGGAFCGSYAANGFYHGLSHPAEIRFTTGPDVFTLTTRFTVTPTVNVSAVPLTVPDQVYGGGWNGSFEVPTKNAVYDKIESIAAGSIADGDKGDITTSGGGATWTIDNAAVTFAKMQDVAANSVVARAAGTSGVLSGVALAASEILGRGSTGNVAALQLGTGLSMSGTVLRTSPTIQTVANGATITPTFTNDMVNVTAQNANFTLANLTGTAIEGHGFVVRVKDNGTARTWSYGTKYLAADGITLPTTTVVGKTHELGFIYNSVADKFVCISTVTY